MKNTTRRDLLSKLGVGAAAIATMSVTRDALAQQPTVKPATVKPVVGNKQIITKAQAAKLSRNQFQALKEREGVVQVLVGIDNKGLVMEAHGIDTNPTVGLTRDRKVLQLGVRVKDGIVSVDGLEGIINRGGSVAAEGRCTMKVAKGEFVSRPGESMLNQVKVLATF